MTFLDAHFFKPRGMWPRDKKNDITKSNNKTLKLIISLIPFV